MTRWTAARCSKAALAALAAGTLASLVAPAALAYAPTKRVSICGQLGLGAVAMDDVNREVRRGNVFMASRDYISLDELKYGFNFKGDLRCTVKGPWGVALGMGSVKAKSDVDFDQVIRVEPSARLYFAHVSYLFPWRPRGESIRLFAEAGPAFISSAKLVVNHERREPDAGVLRVEELEVDGSGAGGEIRLVGETVFNERITLWSDVGYRFLNSTEDSFKIKISRVADPVIDRNGNGIPDGQELVEGSYLLNAFLDSSGDVQNLDVDWSGVQANIGLRFYLF